MSMNVIPLTSRKRPPRAANAMESYLRRVNDLSQGHDNVPNPVRELRTKGSLVYDPNFINSSITDYTMVELASLANLTKQALIRTEQGIFPSIPEALVALLVNKFDVPYLSLVNQYDSFIEAQRTRHYRLFGDFTIALKGNETIHPLDVLRANWSYPPVGKQSGDIVGEQLNITAMCKLLCLSQSHINRFTKKVHSQLTVPKTLIFALRQNGYDFLEVEAFTDAYERFRSNG